MKKGISLLAAAALMVGLCAGCGPSSPQPPGSSSSTPTNSSASDGYPKTDIQVSIMWSAGGACDSSMRAIAPYVEETLGSTLIMTNRAGGGGAIAMQYVNEQPADGYNILCGSEGAQLSKVLDTYSMDLNDFELINIYAGTYGVVVVGKDSPYQSYEDLVNALKNNPNQVKMGIAGPSSSCYAINAMMTMVHETQPNLISYDGDGAAVTALLGGEVDYTAVSLTSAMSYISSGDLRALAVTSDNPLAGLEGVPTLLSLYPEFAPYAPWGTFWGVWVRKGTDESIVKKLQDAFHKAASSDEYAEFLTTLSAFPLNLTGSEAQEYMDNYQRITAWLLYDTGAAVNSPEDFQIPRAN